MNFYFRKVVLYVYQVTSESSYFHLIKTKTNVVERVFRTSHFCAGAGGGGRVEKDTNTEVQIKYEASQVPNLVRALFKIQLRSVAKSKSKY